MADTASKTDTPIAEKVAEAVATDNSAAKADAKQAVAKPAETEAKAPAAAKAPQKKTAQKKAAKKPASPKKSSAKTTSSKTRNTTFKSKEPKMATKKTDTNFAATNAATDMFADLSTRAQGAYDKTRKFAGEAVEFSKGNVEAVVESGKILGEGMQSIAKDTVENTRGTIEAMTADAKDYAAVRSPSELVQLNSTIASRNFDAMVAQTSKNVEAWTKLATEAFTPIQNRVSIAVEKARTAA